MTKDIDLGDNLSAAAQALAADDEQTQPLKPRAGQKKVAPAAEKRVRIMLEDNDQIPPGGQFIAVDGRTFLLQPGHEVDVPLCVIDVLDHAVTSVPVTDDMHTVIGYRDRLRFPYRVITAQRGA
jgi:hypothetical protein